MPFIIEDLNSSIVHEVNPYDFGETICGLSVADWQDEVRWGKDERVNCPICDYDITDEDLNNTTVEEIDDWKVALDKFRYILEAYPKLPNILQFALSLEVALRCSSPLSVIIDNEIRNVIIHLSGNGLSVKTRRVQDPTDALDPAITPVQVSYEELRTILKLFKLFHFKQILYRQEYH